MNSLSAPISPFEMLRAELSILKGTGLFKLISTSSRQEFLHQENGTTSIRFEVRMTQQEVLDHTHASFYPHVTTLTVPRELSGENFHLVMVDRPSLTMTITPQDQYGFTSVFVTRESNTIAKLSQRYKDFIARLLGILK